MSVLHPWTAKGVPAFRLGVPASDSGAPPSGSGSTVWAYLPALAGLTLVGLALVELTLVGLALAVVAPPLALCHREYGVVHWLAWQSPPSSRAAVEARPATEL